jgi:hypothetical protein
MCRGEIKKGGVEPPVFGVVGVGGCSYILLFVATFCSYKSFLMLNL